MSSNRKPQPTGESMVKRDLFTPKYRKRVARDKSKYHRKRDKPVHLD